MSGVVVSLPKEIAKVMDKLFGNASRKQKDWAFFNIIKLDERYLIPEAVTIKHYFGIKGYLELAIALYFGYSIVKTKEERINEGLKQVVETWLKEDTLGSDSKDADQLAGRIKGFVQSVYAESTN